MALRIFCSELTKEINVLEHKKYDETVNASVIMDLEKQTSQRYLYLGQILHDHPDLEKECILTAFSMNPTHECFQLVCKLASTDQSTTQATTVATTTTTPPTTVPTTSTETSTVEAAPATAETAATSPAHNESIDALPTITSADLLLNSKGYDASRAPNRLLDSLTCLSVSVRSDLVCLLTVPRIKNLNWLVPWPKLQKECEELLVTEKKMKIVENTTASANDKLKYINLNYDDFKDLTPFEYPGIEKGYEIYVADSDSDESVKIVPNKRNDDSDVEITGGHASGDDTDTAPESKEFIIKEARRIRERKRRMIRRSQKLLEQSESKEPTVQIKSEPIDEYDQQKKRQRGRPKLTDSLKKPIRKPRKRLLKTEKPDEESISGAEPTIKIEPDTDQLIADIKLEPADDIEIKVEPTDENEIKCEPMDDSEIKQEPIDDHTKYDCDEDVTRTFADLSNVQHFNGANFSLCNNFYSVIPKNEAAEQVNTNGTEQYKSTEKSIQPSPSTPPPPSQPSVAESEAAAMADEQAPVITNSDSNHEPLSKFSELTYVPNQYEQMCTTTTSTETITAIASDDNTELVNSIVSATTEPLTQANEQISAQQFALICNNVDFDEDEKMDMQFPILVGNMNELLGLNSTQISYLSNDVTINRTESVQETESASQSPVINELCPLTIQQPTVIDESPLRMVTPIETDSVVALDSNNKSLCDVPSALNATNLTVTVDVQIPKPKNPLMAFRKPKKITNIKPNDTATVDLSNGLSNDSIATKSPLIVSPTSAFKYDGRPDIDWTSTPSSNQDAHRNGTTAHLVHGHQYDLSPLNNNNNNNNNSATITNTAPSNGQV